MKRILSAFTIALAAAPVLLHAQVDFHVAGRDVQVHGFASQGFAYSGDNNYLTMKTSDGSFAMTDGGINASTQVTNKLRVGAQLYMRNIGQLGKWRPALDWAFADYKFNDYAGVRVGKVKTALGLFNDTQDMEALHTWAILPQSVYPTDLRASMIAHTGGDFYGQISLKKAGSLSYTAYVGTRSDDKYDGNHYSTMDNGAPIKTWNGWMYGADGRWTTPVSGLMLGSSWVANKSTLEGTLAVYGGAPYTFEMMPNHTTAAYADYSRGNFHGNFEFRNNHEIGEVVIFGAASKSDSSTRGWFASGAYRISKRVEAGTYYSRFTVAAPVAPGPAADHIYDNAATIRFDLSRFLSLKAEGHHIDGYGDTYSAHGFYLRSNPTGLKPTTNMVVLRLGFHI